MLIGPSNLKQRLENLEGPAIAGPFFVDPYSGVPMKPWWNRLAEAWAHILADRWAAEQERKVKSQSSDGDPRKPAVPPIDGNNAVPPRETE